MGNYKCPLDGTTWSTNEDAYCPECGHRGEVIRSRTSKRRRRKT